eukprot:5157734-Prymnesium_polylepis.3
MCSNAQAGTTQGARDVVSSKDGTRPISVCRGGGVGDAAEAHALWRTSLRIKNVQQVTLPATVERVGREPRPRIRPWHMTIAPRPPAREERVAVRLLHLDGRPPLHIEERIDDVPLPHASDGV